MGAIEKMWRWFEPPAVETTLYRCLECNVDVGPEDSFCPECGREVQEVTEPVEYVQWEIYH